MNSEDGGAWACNVLASWWSRRRSLWRMTLALIADQEPLEASLLLVAMPGGIASLTYNARPFTLAGVELRSEKKGVEWLVVTWHWCEHGMLLLNACSWHAWLIVHGMLLTIGWQELEVVMGVAWLMLICLAFMNWHWLSLCTCAFIQSHSQVSITRFFCALVQPYIQSPQWVGVFLLFARLRLDLWACLCPRLISGMWVM